MNRSSGVLMHISSLPGEFGCGSFGAEARKFVDFLADCGFTYWQVLPLNPTSYGDSPYQSPASMAGSPYLIDLMQLFEEGLLSVDELLMARQATPWRTEYGRLAVERVSLLCEAGKRMTDKTPVKAFLDAHPAIESVCRFMALKEQNGGKVWTDWEITTPDPRLVDGWAFIQYTFFKQWLALKEYANKKGVFIIGDIPFYVSHDSADVWANPHMFHLDENYKPTRVAGVPPDCFSEDGQLWGNPLYRWEEMKKDGFAWWRARMEAMFELYDGVRIDHFRAIDTYYDIPATAATAKEGKWRLGPGYPLIKALKEVAGDRLLIAEDLGDLTPGVHKLMAKGNLPGMRIFEFAFGEADSPYLPHNYVENCVAYTGTHDNDTLLGFIWSLDEGTRSRVMEYCHHNPYDFDNGYDDIFRTLLGSHANLVIFPMQDILRYGSDCRMNTPGTPSGNWEWRIMQWQIDEVDKQKYRHMLDLYCRLPIVKVEQK